MKTLLLHSILVLLIIASCDTGKTGAELNSEEIIANYHAKEYDRSTIKTHLPMFRDPIWYHKLTMRNLDQKYLDDINRRIRPDSNQ